MTSPYSIDKVMATKKTKVILIFSVILNVILGIVLFITYSPISQLKHNGLTKGSAFETIQGKAEIFVRKAVCDNLYYPNSYDPVKTSVDSVFYGPLTDAQCVNAAIELIDLRIQYSNAEYSYNEAVDQIKFFGRTDLGSNHWGKDRDNAKAKMHELQEKMCRQQSVIKNRDTSMDGKFIGWQVVHRYRASNSDGAVSFGDVLYILNPEVTECFFRYSLDDNDRNNLKSIKEVIESELAINSETNE